MYIFKWTISENNIHGCTKKSQISNEFGYGESAMKNLFRCSLGGYDCRKKRRRDSTRNWQIDRKMVRRKKEAGERRLMQKWRESGENISWILTRRRAPTHHDSKSVGIGNQKTTRTAVQEIPARKNLKERERNRKVKRKKRKNDREMYRQMKSHRQSEK